MKNPALKSNLRFGGVLNPLGTNRNTSKKAVNMKMKRLVLAFRGAAERGEGGRLGEIR
jgi:hypothetical protein